jgi:hypothetical protein
MLSLTLSGPAPPGGASVGVSSGDNTAIPTQSYYTIPAGRTSAVFSLQAGTVTTQTVVPVSAGYGGSSQVAMLTITPSAPALTLSSISISPSVVSPGDTATVTVTLSGPAPPEGATVSISSSNLTAFPSPPVCLIPAGQSAATFGVQAGTVTTETRVSVSGGYGGSSQVAVLKVMPPHQVRH